MSTEKSTTETIQCSSVTTSFSPHHWEWSSGRLLDPDCYGDVTCIDGLDNLPEDVRDEVMDELSEILGDITLNAINKALARQAPCARYAPGTSSVCVCANHVGSLDPDAALAESNGELERWVNDNTGPVAEAWRQIESLVADRLAQSTSHALSP